MIGMKTPGNEGSCELAGREWEKRDSQMERIENDCMNVCSLLNLNAICVTLKPGAHESYQLS